MEDVHEAQTPGIDCIHLQVMVRYHEQQVVTQMLDLG